MTLVAKPKDLAQLTTPAFRDEAIAARRGSFADYLTVITTLKHEVTAVDLETLRDQLAGRLETGWQRLDEEWTQKREDLFNRLLAEYEIVCDALRDDPWPD